MVVLFKDFLFWLWSPGPQPDIFPALYWPQSNDSHSGIDYDDINYYSWGEDKVRDRRAAKVLAWALEMLAKGKFDRGDYRQLIILIVVWLSHRTSVENFRFPVPGAHHFARCSLQTKQNAWHNVV